MPLSAAPFLIAVDIGNSRIKLRKRGAELFSAAAAGEAASPISSEKSSDLFFAFDRSGFDVGRLAEWCKENVGGDATWLVSSVHRGAAEEFAAAVADIAVRLNRHWPLRMLNYRDVPMPLRLDEPERVGMDRLLSALTADRLRRRDRPAIVVDLGTAITVDLVDASGVFTGGAILPGIAMSARALHEQTDALPLVAREHLDRPPEPLGKSTVAAIEAGLYWGAVGAIRELIQHYSAGMPAPPDVFVTGGASPHVAELLATNDNAVCGTWLVRYMPHLVLTGIMLTTHALRPAE
jgi:type III pantothenate kinase